MVSSRQRRLAKLQVRLKNQEGAAKRCRVYPCTNATTANQGEGLNRLYCRKHIEHYRRHGSYVKRSYGAGELRCYRMRALMWLEAHQNSPGVRAAIEGVRRLYNSAGRPVEAFRLAGRGSAERAKATWAQLRIKKVDPQKVLAAWIAVDQRLKDDPQPDRHREYRLVQVAKLIHRMAGGTHKEWLREGADEGVQNFV